MQGGFGQQNVANRVLRELQFFVRSRPAHFQPAPAPHFFGLKPAAVTIDFNKNCSKMLYLRTSILNDSDLLLKQFV